MAQTIQAPHLQPLETRLETVEIDTAPVPHVVERATLGVISLGVALGITAALMTFIIGLTTAIFGWGILVVQVLATLFIGYEPTFVGSISGAVWAFVDFFIAGVIFAWLYNRLLRRHVRD
jgi:hypothetical protein